MQTSIEIEFGEVLLKKKDEEPTRQHPSGGCGGCGGSGSGSGGCGGSGSGGSGANGETT